MVENRYVKLICTRRKKTRLKPRKFTAVQRLQYLLWQYGILTSSVKEYVVVSQLVEALCYKPEDREFDSRWRYRPGVDSASNRNEYQEYFLGGKES
jgi:hypothetical protein